MADLTWIVSVSSSLLNLLISGLIGLTIAYLFKFYGADRRKYPPGPLPLPLLGNLLHFKNRGDKLPDEIILSFKEKYGSIFTFWMSSSFPQIVVADAKLVKEALNSFHFAGRPTIKGLNEIFFEDDSIDIVLADWGREWEVLRKISHSAVRKFAVSDELAPMIDKCVKNFLADIEKEHHGGYFEPDGYVAHLMMSLLATITYGKHFERDDADFVLLDQSFKTQVRINDKATLMGVMPILQYLWPKDLNDFKSSVRVQRSFALRQLDEHENTYVEGEVRDFTDAMIFALKEAQAENSQDLIHFKRRNMMNVLMDIFGAGSETTRLTIVWTMLYMAAYPDHQRAIRQEVELVIGQSDHVTLDHRTKCPLLQAFISEVMRVRPIIPLNVPHKAIVDTELGGHKIMKGTTMLIPLRLALADKEVWGDPDVFRPERFIDENNHYKPKPNAYFLPFSAGRRTCLGEKLATANTFLLMAGILNQTPGKMIVVPDGSLDLSPDPHRGLNLQAKVYQMKFA